MGQAPTPFETLRRATRRALLGLDRLCVAVASAATPRCIECDTTMLVCTDEPVRGLVTVLETLYECPVCGAMIRRVRLSDLLE
jgi:hypothetical protein